MTTTYHVQGYQEHGQEQSDDENGLVEAARVGGSDRRRAARGGFLFFSLHGWRRGFERRRLLKRNLFAVHGRESERGIGVKVDKMCFCVCMYAVHGPFPIYVVSQPSDGSEGRSRVQQPTSE